MHYRIGEVQKILGISPETLRYFEKMNVIEAKREKQSNYRYYRSKDVNKLFAYKMYRSMEFSMEESIALVSGNSVSSAHDKMKGQIDVLEERQRILKHTITHLKYLSKIMEKSDDVHRTFELAQTQDLYFFANQIDDRFLLDDVTSQLTKECFQSMYACMPAFHWKYPDQENLHYGYGIYAELVSKDLAKEGVYIGKQQCLHGIIKVTSRDVLYSEIHQRIKEAEDQYQVVCNSNVFGRMYHEEKIDEQVYWYFEIWALLKIE